MPKSQTKSAALNLRASIQTQLDTWRQTPGRNKQVPSEIRKAVITFMQCGGNTNDLIKLGISNKQAKDWEMQCASGSPNDSPTFSFSTVIPKTKQHIECFADAAPEPGVTL